MNRTFLLAIVFAFVNSLNAQVNPPIKPVTNNQVISKTLQVKDSLISGAPVRFAVTLNDGFGTAKNFSFSTRYNTNAFSVLISPEAITIKKPGLYHFEGFVSAEAFDDNDRGNGFANPQFTSSLIIGDVYYTIGYRDLMPGTDYFVRGQLESRNFKYSKFFSMDIYIVAPGILKFNRNFTSFINNESLLSSKGWMTGYFMSE